MAVRCDAVKIAVSSPPPASSALCVFASIPGHASGSSSSQSSRLVCFLDDHDRYLRTELLVASRASARPIVCRDRGAGAKQLLCQARGHPSRCGSDRQSRTISRANVFVRSRRACCGVTDPSLSSKRAVTALVETTSVQRRVDTLSFADENTLPARRSFDPRITRSPDHPIPRFPRGSGGSVIVITSAAASRSAPARISRPPL